MMLEYPSLVGILHETLASNFDVGTVTVMFSGQDGWKLGLTSESDPVVSRSVPQVAGGVTTGADQTMFSDPTAEIYSGSNNNSM